MELTAQDVVFAPPTRESLYVRAMGARRLFPEIGPGWIVYDAGRPVRLVTEADGLTEALRRGCAERDKRRRRR